METEVEAGKIEGGFAGPLDKKNNSAFILLASSFATSILDVFGPEQAQQYLLASDYRRHAWHAWFSEKQSKRLRPDPYRRFLVEGRSRDIVSDAYGSCPPGYLPALKKLGARARSNEFYRALFVVLERGGVLAQYVHHLKDIHDEEILALCAIRPSAISDRLLRAMLKSGLEPANMPEMSWLVSRLKDVVPEDAIERAIARKRNPLAVVRDLLKTLPFPIAPFPGTAELTPVTSAEDLAATGRSLRNCLRNAEVFAGALIAVLSGRKYFYQWEGEQRALLEFSKIGDIGWVLTECAGRNNDLISTATMQQIRSAVRATPLVWAGSRAGILTYLANV
jgi:hypothetical protein